MASLWIRSGYDMKVEVSDETYQVGAHFEALMKAIFVSPLNYFERFFRISNSPAGLWFHYKSQSLGYPEKIFDFRTNLHMGRGDTGCSACLTIPSILIGPLETLRPYLFEHGI